MGEPEYLRDKDLESLGEASQLVVEKQSFRFQDGSIFLRVDLPPHAVAAITIEFKERRMRYRNSRELRLDTVRTTSR